MRIIQVTNWHRFGGGSDFMARVTTDLLKDEGHDVLLLAHDSRTLDSSLRGRLSAFWRGIASPKARAEVRDALRAFRPDLVHVHEVYPYHSPWILRDCKRVGVPVVMTCHDFRLTCPVATHLSHGRICMRCAKGGTYWCVLKNCRGSVAESVGFAARGAVAHHIRLFRDNVSLFVTPSQFLRDRLVASGYPEERFVVVPNMVEHVAEPVASGDGAYMAYAGRMAPEKGIDTLLEAAALCGLPLRIAGGGAPPLGTRPVSHSVAFVGLLEKDALAAFYREARFVVVPSRWCEVFGLVAAEAMMHGLPVLAARSGALPELVEDGVTGLLFEPGNARDLADKMTGLWHDPSLRVALGRRGREKALAQYSSNVYLTRLVSAYRAAIAGERPETALEQQEAGVL
ncbi:MAG: glycosyltransferase [Candidatus Hydrogenedentes bacterium]|nr:glycosyltransferase [Candidatus Hydrogenedentota bacterium]